MATSCPAAYRSRSPRATPLYSLFEHHFDEVPGAVGGALRGAVRISAELHRRAGAEVPRLRPPISLERMSWDGVGEVRYRRKGGHGIPGLIGRDVETFDPAEFLARVIMHIPESRRHLVRYYGWYSNVLRGKRRRDEEGVPELNESPGKGEDGPDARAMRRAWAQLIRRICEVEPLAGPKCGAEMKVIAFITKHEVVDKILRHLRRRGEPGRGREPPGIEGFAAAS